MIAVIKAVINGIKVRAAIGQLWRDLFFLYSGSKSDSWEPRKDSLASEQNRNL